MGDGAAAVLLRKVEKGKGTLSTYLDADGSGTNLLKEPLGGSCLPATYETAKQGYI